MKSKTLTSPNRRQFLTGMAVGAGLAPVAALVGSQQARGAAAAVANLCFGGSDKPALGTQDFTYLGFYNVQTAGTDTTYMRALTGPRMVNGQPRFLTLTHKGALHEFALPSAFGQAVSNPTATWDISAVTGDYTGLWWEEAKQRLWVTETVDYGVATEYYPTRISTMSLGANGAVSNIKTISLEGVSSKRVYGGAQAVPAWFQARYGVGPYAVGFGGYTSLMDQTSRCSLGPELICIPDPANYGNGATIPASAFKVLLTTPPSQYRGVRATIPVNYYDGGDPRQNPSSRPSAPPAAGAQWLSPNAQGLGWMVWGDSYYNTGMWIDGPNKQGYAAVASLGKGYCWYQSSALACDDRQFELHVWDSATLMNGLQTRPTGMMELAVPRGHVWNWTGDTPGNMTGATYDAAAKRMYAIGYPLGPDVYTGRLYVYAVNS